MVHQVKWVISLKVFSELTSEKIHLVQSTTEFAHKQTQVKKNAAARNRTGKSRRKVVLKTTGVPLSHSGIYDKEYAFHNYLKITDWSNSNYHNYIFIGYFFSNLY